MVFEGCSCLMCLVDMWLVQDLLEAVMQWMNMMSSRISLIGVECASLGLLVSPN